MPNSATILDELIDIGLGEIAPVSATPDEYAQHLKIMDKRQRLIPYVPNRAQLHFRQHRTGRDLLLKPRQVGFSTEIQADLNLRAYASTVMGATLAHDAITTANLRSMATRFYDNLPDHLRPLRGFDSATKTTYPQTGSEIIIATAGNVKVGRGFTLSYVHGSEVAYWINADDLTAGVMQAVPEHGIIVLESTANGAQGFFYTECMKALEGDSEFKLHFYPWWWEASYALALDEGETIVYETDELKLVRQYGLTPEQIKWRRKKQKAIPLTFKQEFPEDPVTCFMTSGSSVFGDFAHALYTPVEDRPIDGHHYVMAIDWGGDVDNHAVSIADATAYREVKLWYDRRRDDDAVLADIVAMAKHWRVKLIMPEFNSIGAPFTRRLHKLLYENGIDWGDSPPVVNPLTMTNKEKDNLVKALRMALSPTEGYQLVNDPVGTNEMRQFQTGQTATGLWTYSAPANGHDDTVVVRIICHKACYRFKGI